MGHLMQMNNASNMKGREKTNRLKMRICRKQFSPKFQCRKQENSNKNSYVIIGGKVKVCIHEKRTRCELFL